MPIGRSVYTPMFYSTDISDVSKMEYIFCLKTSSRKNTWSFSVNATTIHLIVEVINLETKSMAPFYFLLSHSLVLSGLFQVFCIFQFLPSTMLLFIKLLFVALSIAVDLAGLLESTHLSHSLTCNQNEH